MVVRDPASFGLVAAFLILIFFLTSTTASARPQYATVVKKVYPPVATSKLGCAVCHYADSRSLRNHFSAKFEAQLGEKNVHDEKKIRRALQEIESEKCGDETWADRLKHGKLPCEHPPEKLRVPFAYPQPPGKVDRLGAAVLK